MPSINLSINEFENLNLYTNKNIEKIITNVINESSNAVFVNMGDDSVILLDHNEGQFYIADYEFNKDDLTIKFENFDSIELERDETSFEESIYDYFDSEEGDILSLTESYKEYNLNQDRFINDLVNEAMNKKSFDDIIDYNNIVEAKKDLTFTSLNESIFKEYKERLNTHPMTTISYFNWKDPIKVSLTETEQVKIINKNAIQKAHDLWKKETFKNAFLEATEIFIENVEEGIEKYKELFEEFPQIYYLDAADRKGVFGKALLSAKNLNEDIQEILEGIDLIFEKGDLKELREDFLFEAEEIEMDDEESIEDQPKEVEPEKMDKLIDDLKKIAEKCEDEDAKKKLDDLINKLEKGKDEGTKPIDVKEAVSILSM